jgi:ribonucleoside-diphosphate reductase alpha chain
MQEPSIEASWDRVALALSAPEAHHRDDWRERFRAALADFRFLPAGGVLAHAGTAHQRTLLNSFVLPAPEDSIQGIFNSLRETLLTLHAGAAVGLDFSTLRPAGSPATRSGGQASGPVSFMPVWELAMAVLASGQSRRNVVLLSLRCDHPDIEAFIHGQPTSGGLAQVRRCVLLTQDFMQAVQDDALWPLLFPLGAHPVPEGAELCERSWSGRTEPQRCVVHRRVPASQIWQQLVAAVHAGAGLRVLFMDRTNQARNLWYSEPMTAASPCGQPLPAHGAYSAGAINLSRLVQHPFGQHPHLDMGGLRALTAVAVRLLDNVYELSNFALKAQEKEAHATRPLALGVTGVADMLQMLGLRYGSPASQTLVHEALSAIRDTAYLTSIELAQEKAPFPAFDKLRFVASPNVLNLPHALQDGIAKYGLRNSQLLAVMPLGSASLLANNVSSGLGPVTAAQAPAQDQLHMQATAQGVVDGAVAQPVYLPADADRAAVEQVMLSAWHLGLKACTVVRESGPAS